MGILIVHKIWLFAKCVYFVTRHKNYRSLSFLTPALASLSLSQSSRSTNTSERETTSEALFQKSSPKPRIWAAPTTALAIYDALLDFAWSPVETATVGGLIIGQQSNEIKCSLPRIPPAQPRGAYHRTFVPQSQNWLLTTTSPCFGLGRIGVQQYGLPLLMHDGASTAVGLHPAASGAMNAAPGSVVIPDCWERRTLSETWCAL